MTIEQDFLPFAASGGANVLTQTAYAALGALTGGFATGIAPSAACNKAWRQSSIMAAVLGNLIVAQTGQTVIDDGTTTTILTNLEAAITALAAADTRTWHDVTSSRSLSVTYTNSTANTIQVNFDSGDGGSINGNCTVVINGSVTINGSSGYVGYSSAHITFDVPPGGTYNITAQALYKWDEL